MTTNNNNNGHGHGTDYFKFFIKEELGSNKKLETPHDYEAMINCMRNAKLSQQDSIASITAYQSQLSQQDGPTKSGFDKSKAVSWCNNNPLVMEYPKEQFSSSSSLHSFNEPTLSPNIERSPLSQSLNHSMSSLVGEGISFAPFPPPRSTLKAESLQVNPSLLSLKPPQSLSSSSSIAIDNNHSHDNGNGSANSNQSNDSLQSFIKTKEIKNNLIREGIGNYFMNSIQMTPPITHMIKVYSGNFMENTCYKTIVVAESQSLRDICHISSVKYLIDHDFYEYELNVIHHKTFVNLKGISSNTILSEVIATAKKNSKKKSKKSFPQTDYKLVLNRRLDDIPAIPFYVNVSVSTPNVTISSKSSSSSRQSSRRLLIKSNWTGYEMSKLIIDTFELIPPYGFEIQPKLFLSPSNLIVNLNQTIAKIVQEKSDNISQCGLNFILEPLLVIK